ncbi:hypothetical protein FB451DRAFT_1569004 [Mycena latifolia]|nr:hypothetical protein FB451DRAFT_1569004 [Mycena latifolia]
MDPTMCRGRDEEGNQCICMHPSETHVINDKVLCKNCGHIETAHPEPKATVGSFIRGYRDAGKLGSSRLGSTSASTQSVKASKEEAEAETSAGLRKKRKSDTNTEPPLKKPRKKDEDPPKKPKSDLVPFGKLVFLVDGIVNGVLQRSKIPSVSETDAMRAAGLVVLSDPNDPKKQLAIDRAWNCEHLNREVKRWIPKPIEFLQKQQSPGDTGAVKKQLWLGVVKQGKTLTLASDELPTGVELADHCKRPGTAKNDRVLYLASKLKIPKKRYLDWDASDSEPESEDLGSDVDSIPSEDIIMTPRKPAPKKGKSKEEAAVKKEPIVKQEQEDTDMRKAARMRTRISTGVLKHTPLFIPGSSDGPEPEPEPQAGPSQEVLVLSDDDNEDFPPAPLLPATPSLSSITNAWTAPLHIDSPKSPSPAPSIEEESPEIDPPTFFDDFPWDVPSTSSSETSFPVASSSSSTASSTPLVPNFTSAWTPVSTSGSADTPANAGGSTSEVISSDVSSQRHRFKLMGKGQAGRNPWSESK